MATATEAWAIRWRAIVSNAVYHHDWGLERAWRANADAWGYPLHATEKTFEYEGRELAGRVFSGAGLVLWDPATGPLVVGWPA